MTTIEIKLMLGILIVLAIIITVLLVKIVNSKYKSLEYIELEKFRDSFQESLAKKNTQIMDLMALVKSQQSMIEQHERRINQRGESEIVIYKRLNDLCVEILRLKNKNIIDPSFMTSDEIRDYVMNTEYYKNVPKISQIDKMKQESASEMEDILEFKGYEKGTIKSLFGKEELVEEIDAFILQITESPVLHTLHYLPKNEVVLSSYVHQENKVISILIVDVKNRKRLYKTYEYSNKAQLDRAITEGSIRKDILRQLRLK
jgi:hypothetical protein